MIELNFYINIHYIIEFDFCLIFKAFVKLLIQNVPCSFYSQFACDILLYVYKTFLLTVVKL